MSDTKLTAESIAEQWLIPQFSSEDDKKELTKQIKSFTKQKVKKACERQRQLCADEIEDESSEVLQALVKVVRLLVIDAPEPK